MKTERKKRDKKHLKGRILRSISLILICSMILSTLIGYLYFNQVVRKQRLEEEKNRLMQVGSQIAFQAEDNRRFAQSILVDEQLQYLLEENVKGNEFRRQSQYDKVTKRLVFYNNLRTYLEGSDSADGRRKLFRKQLQCHGYGLSGTEAAAEGIAGVYRKRRLGLFQSVLRQ